MAKQAGGSPEVAPPECNRHRVVSLLLWRRGSLGWPEIVWRLCMRMQMDAVYSQMPLAKHHLIKERLTRDVKLLDVGWATESVGQAIECKDEVVLIIAGFPFTGLSKQRGRFKPHLKDRNSALSENILWIWKSLRKVAHGILYVKLIVENVVM